MTNNFSESMVEVAALRNALLLKLLSGELRVVFEKKGQP